MEFPAPLAHLPEGIELVTDDVSAGDWVDERLLPFRGSEGGVRVGEIVPTGFEAYARVIHPAGRDVGGRAEPVRWAEIASDAVPSWTLRCSSRRSWVRSASPTPKSLPHTGASWSPSAERSRRPSPHSPRRWTGAGSASGRATAFEPDTPGSPEDLEPMEGSLPDITLRDLVDFLSGWTELDEPCWFCMWDGNGLWWKGAHGVLTDGSVEVVAHEWLIDDERDRVLRATPTAGTAQRKYFLMRGVLRSALGLLDAAGDSPNLWWPEGRAWLISTEVDGFSTYVGGPVDLVAALIASGAVEAFPASLDDLMDPGPYRRPQG